MDTYSFLRELADSWVLLAMTLFYIGTIVWAFRPGSRAIHDHISRIPLRDGDLNDFDAAPDSTAAKTQDPEASKDG